MDLKQKFKDFLNLSKEENVSHVYTAPLEELLGLTETSVASCVFDRNHVQADSNGTLDSTKDEILDDIEAVFSCEQTDGGRYQLEKLNLSPTLDLNVIRSQRQVLGTQLTGVTLQLYALIHQKQSDCSLELENVIDLQDKLDMVHIL
jgi:hypothetical protein